MRFDWFHFYLGLVVKKPLYCISPRFNLNKTNLAFTVTLKNPSSNYSTSVCDRFLCVQP